MMRAIKKKIIYLIIVTVVNMAFGEKGWGLAMKAPEGMETLAVALETETGGR